MARGRGVPGDDGTPQTLLRGGVRAQTIGRRYHSALHVDKHTGTVDC